MRISCCWYKEDEIDLVAVSDESGSVIFAECKWGDLSLDEANGILRRLKIKAKLVRAESYKDRKYSLFCAGNVEGKSRLRKEGYLVFDREDIENFASSGDDR